MRLNANALEDFRGARTVFAVNSREHTDANSGPRIDAATPQGQAGSELSNGSQLRQGPTPNPRDGPTPAQRIDIRITTHSEKGVEILAHPIEAELIVAKHRNGPIGEVSLTFLSKYPRFANLYRERAGETIPAGDGVL